MRNYAEETSARVEYIRAYLKSSGARGIVYGNSGGKDSALVGILSKMACENTVGIIMPCASKRNYGMDKADGLEVAEKFGIETRTVDLTPVREAEMAALKGVTDPEQKRKTIGRLFVEIFREESKKHGKLDFLAQGTIYPDVVESGTNSAVIKSHHNVGGLPKDLGFEGVVEPLRGLFKDEVRKLGLLLGLPEALVWRQPFPGPGLGIRVIGEITREKLDILRAADAIFRSELLAAGERADQYFAVLTDTRSVGVMGDDRTYDYTLALRAVRTNDFMTCEFARLTWDLLARVSSRITNEVRGINRVVYDVTSKPPATIEFE